MGEYSENSVYALCKWKMIPVETIPGWGGVKQSSGKGELKYDTFDIL
jgi:hypothetical protein